MWYICGDLAQQTAKTTGSKDDAEALRETLERAVTRVCPPWMAAHRDDLVQAAMLKLLEMQKREGERVFPASYLRKVAYAVLVDEIRRLRRRSEVSLTEGADGTPNVPEQSADEPNPEHRAHGKKVGQGIADCLREHVKVERRQALVLYLQGYSVPDAARLLGWSAKKTENLVYRGMADLRRCLEGKGLRP